MTLILKNAEEATRIVESFLEDRFSASMETLEERGVDFDGTSFEVSGHWTEPSEKSKTGEGRGS
jgi:hypothetical protein